MKKKVIVWVLMVILLVVAAVSGYQVYTILSAYHQGESSYQALEQYITIPQELETTVPAVTQTEETETDTDIAEEAEPALDIQWPEVDFDALTQVNPQIVGWIYIPDTQINYPIAQGEDNDYYLTHLFDGGRNSSGCIFLDCRNAGDFSNSHSVIYGHHMKNGSMFAGLVKYKEQSYYEEHSVGYLMTPSGNYLVELFSGYVANEEMDAWQVAFSTDEAYAAWLTEAKERSLFQSQVTPQLGDQVLTLSTCSYEFENARFVVVGVLKKG